jgi:hypothetical protein
VTVDGGSTFSNSSLVGNRIVDGPYAGLGLRTVTAGDIKLYNIFAQSNNAEAAYLDNRGGTGNISAYSSRFPSNGTNGLEAFSDGTITLTGVISNGNTWGGAVLTNCQFTTAGSPTCIGSG